MTAARPRRWPAGLGAALALAVAAALVLSRPAPHPARVVGGNLPLTTVGPVAAAVRAENSPRLVASPAQPASLAMAARVDAPHLGCAVHVSADGGRTWADAALPVPPGPAVPCFAPDAAFGADGRLFVSWSSIDVAGGDPAAVWVAASADGGRTFAPAVRAAGPEAFEVRLAADRHRAGRLWLAWVQAAAGTSTWGFREPGNPVVVSRSDDGGATWTAPRPLSAPARARAVAPTLAAGDGSLYAAYLDVGDDRLDYEGAHEGRGGPAYGGPWTLVVARSDDGGGTWSEVPVATALVPEGRFLVLVPPTPSLAVAGRRVYAAFHDARLGDADVWLWSSADGAATWGPARRVNDTPAGDGTAQYLPEVALSPGGRVSVLYYDRRADAADARNQVSLQTSTDGGHTFGPRALVSDRSFDAGIGLGSDRGLPDLGSRLGLVATDGGAIAAWADTRAGTPLTGRQDLARAALAFPSQSAAARRPLAAAAVVVAAALLAMALRPSTRRPAAVRAVPPVGADVAG